MLPQALQRAERPAETLTEKRCEGIRDFGVADGIRFVFDSISRAPDLPRQIHILGHRLAAIAARRKNRVAPPRTDGAGNDGDGVHDRVRAAIEILTGDVFDRLPVRQRIHAIADFDVAGDRAHFLVLEVTDEIGDRAAAENRVGVESDDDLAARRTNAAIERRCFAGVLLTHQRHFRMSAECAGHFAGGVVGRAVIDHDDVQRLVAIRQNGANRSTDDFLFVECSDDHAD